MRALFLLCKACVSVQQTWRGAARSVCVFPRLSVFCLLDCVFWSWKPVALMSSCFTLIVTGEIARNAIKAARDGSEAAGAADAADEGLCKARC